MSILRDGVRVTLPGLLTLSVIGALVFWTTHSFVNGNGLSPLVWVCWLTLSSICLIGSLKWHLFSLSDRPFWPVGLALVACVACVALLIASLAG